MEFLKIYLAALGGTVTSLAIVGFFGKTLIEHWFKKDFKRFEATLDALVSKDKTQFEHNFVQRSLIGKETFALCNAVHLAFIEIKFAEFYAHLPDNCSSSTDIPELNNSLIDKTQTLNEQLADNTYLFDENFVGWVKEFSEYAVTEAHFPSTNPAKLAEGLKPIAEKLKTIEAALIRMLGTDNI